MERRNPDDYDPDILTLANTQPSQAFHLLKFKMKSRAVLEYSVVATRITP